MTSPSQRRLAILLVLAASAAMAALGGCGPQPAPSASPSATSSGSPAAGTPVMPALGMQELPDFMPFNAANLAGGVVAVGSLRQGQPCLLEPVGGTDWQGNLVAKDARIAYGAAQSGDTAVVVGTVISTGPPGSPEQSYLAMSGGGGPWYSSDINAMYGGRSVEVSDVAAPAAEDASGLRFAIVGSTTTSQNGEIGSPGGTVPTVIIYKDDLNGAHWHDTAELPLPSDVTGAQGWGVTFAPSGTAFPGILVAGTGWATDKALGRRDVAIVWQSTDGGKSWTIVSSTSDFDQQDRNMTASYIAADSTTVMVAGTADVANQPGGSGGRLQKETVEWIAGSDGTWHVISDGDNLAADRSSKATALTSRIDGGFLIASEVYDTSSGPSKPASGGLTGNPEVQIYSASDSLTFPNLTPKVPDISQAGIIGGIAEAGDRDVFVGLDASQKAQAWVVDRATLQ